MHQGLKMVKTGEYTAVESDIFDDIDEAEYQSCPTQERGRTRIQSGVLTKRNYCSQNEEYDDNHNRNKQNKTRRKKKKDRIIHTPPQPTRKSTRLAKKNILLNTPTSLSPRSERVIHVEGLTYPKKIDFVNVC